MDLNVLTLRHAKTVVKLALRKLVGPRPSSPPAPPAAEADGQELIDVGDLIARSSIDELNRAADEYFAKLSDWSFHLAKPFSNISDTPHLLINLGTAIQMMRLAPGLRILDFGAGTGWTSRYLTQLGCEVILLDVSKTALDIARDLYGRQPVIGSQPEPRYLEFDGRRIDLPDGSVERILSFDAFHHAPNPYNVIREFGRVLAPGGIAAFVEPGPEHSKSAQSQSEMRNFGVIENDVDIHAIARAAREAGFSDLRLAAFNIPPYHVSLDEYDDLLQGGETYLRWAEATRAFLRNARSFYLVREGDERLDSRYGEGLAASIEIEMANSAGAGSAIPGRATVTNVGSALWLPSGTVPAGVSLGCHLYEAGGGEIAHDYHWAHLAEPPRRIEPGETVEIAFELPALSAGHYMLEFDCVADRVMWFAQGGSRAVRIDVEVG